jgi:hypothetical protein
MDDQQATVAMAQALTSAGIAFNPSEAESAHLGIDYKAPAATIPVTPAPAAAAPKPQTVGEQIAALNSPNLGDDAGIAAAMAPPADPGSYELPGLTVGQKFTPEQIAVLTEARGAMHDAGLPASVAKFVSQRVNDGLANPPNDLQRSHSSAACTTALRAAWQGDYDSNLAAVRQHVQELAKTRPNLIGWLEQSGAGNDAFVVRSIFNAMQARKP